MATALLFKALSNSSYDKYNAATDPADITSLYEKTNSYNNLSTVSLGVGIAALVPAVYFQFDISRLRQTLANH